MYDKNDNLIGHFDSTCLVVYAVCRLVFAGEKNYNLGNIQGLKSQRLQTMLPI